MLHYSGTVSSCTGIFTGFTELEYVYFDMNQFFKPIFQQSIITILETHCHYIENLPHSNHHLVLW